MYRDPDPFRIPRPSEIHDSIDLRELLTVWTAGFPEPRTFTLRAARLLAERASEFDVVHDNQSLGTGLLTIAATGMPVVYKLRIALDMMGDWALRLNISGPLRDLVIAKHEFGTGHGMPADHSRSSTSGSHSSPGMPDGSQHKQ